MISAINVMNVSAPKSGQGFKTSPKENYHRDYQDGSTLNPVGICHPNRALVAFGGERKLFKEYLEFAKGKDYKVIEFLKQAEAEPMEVFNFLTHVTTNRGTSKKFIEEITRDMDNPEKPVNPRKSKEIVKFLSEKLGGRDNFEKWYFQKNGYFDAFAHRYVPEFYDEAKSVAELVEFSPNWISWELRKKAKELGEDGFTLGELPEKFGDEENLRKLIRQIRFKNKRPWSVYHDQDYGMIRKMNGEFASKLVVKIDDKYILKIGHQPEELSSHMDKVVRNCSDSSFLNGMIDYYANFHKCENAAKMLCYDSQEDAVLYAFTDGEDMWSYSNTDGFISPKELNEKLSDMNAIGLYPTDRLNRNYLSSNGKNIAIDVGYVEYIDALKPGMQKYHICMPNMTGYSKLALQGAFWEALR